MNINSKILVRLLCITVSARTQQETPMNSPQPAPEMRSLAKAFEGKWRISEKYEPDEWTPKGGEGHGEEVWRSGPGGFTLMEEFHDQSPAGESFGLGLTWWNKTKGFQGMWCVNANPNGCDLESAVAGSGPKWDGKRLVIDTEFFRGGKKVAWHEVLSDINATSFTQTADIGEASGPLKRWVTIRATKVPDASMENKETTAREAELRAVMAERRQASIEGDTDKIASSLAKEYLQTDINGYIQNKTAWLNEYFNPLADLIKAGKSHWEVFEEKDVQLRTYGDSAVVIGRMELKGTGARPAPQHTWVADLDAHPSLTLHFTRFYIKRDSKWLLTALHNAGAAAVTTTASQQVAA